MKSLTMVMVTVKALMAIARAFFLLDRGLAGLALSPCLSGAQRRCAETCRTTAGTGYLVCVSPRCRAIVGVSARQVWHGRGMQSGLPSPSAWKLEVARSGQHCSAGVSARQVTGVSARCLAIVGASARHVWHGRGMLSGLPSPSAQKVEVARVGQNCCAGVSARQVSGSRVSHQRHCRASAFSEEDTRLR